MKTKMEKLTKKCVAEFKRFCTRLPWNSRSQIVEMACEISSRQDILTVIKEKDFDDEIAAYLLEQDNTIDFLYNRYLDLDNLSVTDKLVDMIEEILEKEQGGSCQ